MNRLTSLAILLALALPLSADDARERQDIARELHRIALLSETRPPSTSELIELRKYHGRELADIRRSLEILRRSMEGGGYQEKKPSVANGGTTAPRRKPRVMAKLYDPGRLGETKRFGR